MKKKILTLLILSIVTTSFILVIPAAISKAQQSVTANQIGFSSYPVKTTYATGEALDLTGMTVICNYSDGTSSTISDYTVYQIIDHVASNIEGVSRISRFRAENYPDGIYIEMDLVLIYGHPIKPLLREIQQKVREEVDKLTALNIKALNLVAKSLVMEHK
jgi:uncharacterized alkaline shock family protein YloU